MWWLIGSDHPFLFSLCFWIFCRLISEHQCGGLSVWDYFWVLEGCSSFHVFLWWLGQSGISPTVCCGFPILSSWLHSGVWYKTPTKTNFLGDFLDLTFGLLSSEHSLFPKLALWTSWIPDSLRLIPPVVLAVFGYWGFLAPYWSVFSYLGFPCAVLFNVWLYGVTCRRTVLISVAKQSLFFLFGWDFILTFSQRQVLVGWGILLALLPGLALWTSWIWDSLRLIPPVLISRDAPSA